jgi:hypothetical protein
MKKKRLDRSRGLHSLKDPFGTDRKAIDLLVEGKISQARAIIEEALGRNRAEAQRIVSQAEAGAK